MKRMSSTSLPGSLETTVPSTTIDSAMTHSMRTLASDNELARSSVKPVVDINMPTSPPTSSYFSTFHSSGEPLNSTVYSTNLTQPSVWDQPTMIGLSVTLCLLIFISLIGNSLILLTMVIFKHMRTKTNIFIANLAFADLAVTLLCMPFTLTTIITGKWVFGMVMCNTNAFFDALCLVGSIHSLMYISIHKFFSLVKPLSRIITHRRMWMMISVAWLSAFSCAIGPLVGWSSNEFKVGTTQCGPKYPETPLERSHAYYVLTVGYFIPILVIIVLYTFIFRTISQYTERLRLHSSMDIQQIFRQQKRIISTLFLLILSFVLLWTPYFVYASLGMFLGFDKLPVWLNLFGYWCGYANSAVNPIIYAWRAKSFRDAIKDLCCCRKRSPFSLGGSSGRVAKDAWNTRRDPYTQSPKRSARAKPVSNLTKKKSISLQSLSNVNNLIFPYVTSSRPVAAEDNTNSSRDTLYSEHPFREPTGSLWSIDGGSYTSDVAYRGAGEGEGISGVKKGNNNMTTLERGQNLFEMAVMAAEQDRMVNSQSSLDSVTSRGARCLSDGAKDNLEMDFYEVRPRPMQTVSSFRSFQGSALKSHLSPENEDGPRVPSFADPVPLQVYGTFALEF
ncbi:probable G-protein coupled receptor 63 [Lytechinus variegatus]|uniref:probable G-protein coupled receptor 63 n=1 Tax=Lytechinus variegatus TaxID=7654 RepID=UPI001BB21DD7|nr:probable G-protein coupled receptor 63 [Lytechinus variegatus]